MYNLITIHLKYRTSSLSPTLSSGETPHHVGACHGCISRINTDRNSFGSEVGTKIKAASSLQTSIISPLFKHYCLWSRYHYRLKILPVDCRIATKEINYLGVTILSDAYL